MMRTSTSSTRLAGGIGINKGREWEEQCRCRGSQNLRTSILRFANRVGEIAEAEGHHPAILTEWGKVNVAWWTHKIKGLHKNDFIMAAKTDCLYLDS